jgi:hypothetical protein
LCFCLVFALFLELLDLLLLTLFLCGLGFCPRLFFLFLSSCLFLFTSLLLGSKSSFLLLSLSELFLLLLECR